MKYPLDTLLAQYWIINNIFYNTVHLFSTVTGRGRFWFTRICRGHDILTRGNVIFTFMHLADDFIQSDLQWIQAIIFFVSMCVPWELNPQPFALLTQCSNHWATGILCRGHEIDKPTWPQQPGIIRDRFIHILFLINTLLYYYRIYYIIKLIYWP